LLAGGEVENVPQTILEVEGLVKHFPGPGNILHRSSEVVRAVDGVSFRVEEGTTFALVGESGCGKTTVAKNVLLLERPTRGEIRFQGKNINLLKGRELREYKRLVQAVFQDPYSSLNPRMQVKDIIGEPLRVHEGLGGRALEARVGELLQNVGLNPVTGGFFPHQFSGGQRQRIAIARALALQPKLIVLDEPVSGLDVSIRAQILNLLGDLQRDFGLSYLLISHDLAIVEHMSHQVGVMYVGKLAELAHQEEIYTNPQHPYTRALLASVPRPDPDVPMGTAISGEVASPINPPSGCRFHPRCPIYLESAICREQDPEWREVLQGHFAACHKVEPALVSTTL
jgi:oligopeptide/dipeptide ABC transporter ATP-binding protein